MQAVPEGLCGCGVLMNVIAFYEAQASNLFEIRAKHVDVDVAWQNHLKRKDELSQRHKCDEPWKEGSGL